MGKYFQQDSNAFDHYQLTEDNSVDVSRSIPSADNLTQPLSEENKQKLSGPRTNQPLRQPSNTPEHIRYIEQQNDHVSHMITDYTEQTKVEMTKKFEKFTPLEMFEKINQLFFVVADLSNKVASLDATMQTFINIATAGAGIPKPSERKVIIDDPADLHTLHNRLNNGEKIEVPASIPEKQPEKPSNSAMSVETAKQLLNDIKQGKGLPTDGYTDKSFNLEEIFPNQSDEALQAAYNVMGQTDILKKAPETPPIRNLKHITGF